MKHYLCYDIRGIQSFIFRIPKLKYIIGGSALIDRFDRETMKNLSCKEKGYEILFSGGGKGTFLCDDEKIAHELKEIITKEAHEIGLDIRFGIDEDYSKASKGAVDLYPYLPEMPNISLKNADSANEQIVPCPVSGLYPVRKGQDQHKIVKKRLFSKTDAETKKMYRYFEDLLLDGVKAQIPEELAYANFFHNVSADDEDDDNGKLGAKALGNRNRWAVICMDGNDMGSQMQYQLQQIKDGKFKAEKMPEWIQNMSAAIDNCSKKATKAGIVAVINQWKDSKDFTKDILPIRPIVVGGDDVTVICHCAYAMTFVKTVIEEFEKLSENSKESWPATGGKITISAGVLYCPVSLPLHSAIEYAEALLASAKTKGRKVKAEQVAKNNGDDKFPTPASIDWEHITDSVISSPHEYRQKDLTFIDGDTDSQINLISRPFTAQELDNVLELKEKYINIPQTMRHKILPAMRKSLNDRLAFIASISKNWPELAASLTENSYQVPNSKAKSGWEDTNGDGVLRNMLLDALQLLEEENRMTKETA